MDLFVGVQERSGDLGRDESGGFKGGDGTVNVERAVGEIEPLV
jgi:hypothetical protein